MEQSYSEDAPPVYRVYIGEMPGRRATKRRVQIVATLRAIFEYLLPVVVGTYAAFVLIL